MDGSASPPEDRRAGATPLVLGRLKERREFLAAAKARTAATPGFVLQARRRTARDAERLAAKAGAAAADAPRFGFTASKKVGNAVARNRAKRRLRALAAEVGPLHARPGWDYVLIARAETTAARPYALMRDELAGALKRAHDAPGGGRDRATARRKRRGGEGAEG